MKQLYTITLLLVTTLVLSWALPAIVRIATTTATHYPFVYYSVLLQRFLIRETSPDNKLTHIDTEGNRYTREAFDSLTPLLSYRQLMLTNSLPDTLLGVPVDPQELRAKTFMWRYNPRNIHTPALPLYFMYESESGRANLEAPEDVFRLKKRITFIDKLTNTENTAKSDSFQSALEAAHFTFPAQQVWGNLSAKKAYDVGYFTLDSRGRLFHLKMTKGAPSVHDTHAGDSLEIAYFNVLEVADHSIYGFLVARNGAIYTLAAGDNYPLTRLDIPPINIDEHSVMLMGNLFYRMVNVTTPDSVTCYVLDAATLRQHDRPHVIHASPNRWNTVARWLFPIYLSFSSRHSDYLQPVFHVRFGWSLFISHLTFFAYLFTAGRKGAKRNPLLRLVNASIIILFGIPGLLASLLFLFELRAKN
ncbi:MAG: DUF4857 domain-containing protein [Prevotellaceae bacterium]|jgi:hypothetical protein|nr:DUF4857 domain-containing protein [Prevotellaceae bacterium]